MRSVPVLAVVAMSLVVSVAPARAYDSGAHAEFTEAALGDEGFGRTAQEVAQVNNWFVDLYEQADKNPASGHAAWWKRLLALVPITENWPNSVVNAANASHFDSTTTTLYDTAGVTAEWGRLQRAVWTLSRRARDTNDPLLLLTVLGASVHQVQDFYTHTNWVEPGSPAVPGGDGPGWSARGYGSYPTWFDIPEPVRNSQEVYTANTGDHERQHGDWNTDGNAGLETAMSKDWPGRPLYTPSAVSAYFATRQWIRAVRSWVADDTFWRKAQRYARHRSQLQRDRAGSLLISLYSGHWQGQGEPLGGTGGPGGSLVDLTLAIKKYFQRFGVVPRGKTVFRSTFERVIRQMAAPNPAGRVGPVAPSSDIQRATRLVRLQVLNMRGLGLGDPGPDEADMYVNARINGQPFTSAVIHGHDSYSFGKPNHPFTFIKAVPVAGRGSEPVESLEATVKTCDARFAGTDDDVYLRVNGSQRFMLDKRLYNDFERGDRDTYSLPIDRAARDGLVLKDITRLEIEKSRDGVAGGWKLCGLRVRANGTTIHADENIDRWLERNERTWRATGFRPRTAFGSKIGVWLQLMEDDLVYGDDDHGDINGDGWRKDISVGYAPGPPLQRDVIGGYRNGGRLGDGDRARLRFRLETITPVVPRFGPVPTIPPVVQPTPEPSPSPSNTPTVPPSSPPPTAKADLVISDFTFSGVTVRNIGAGPAGPFRVNAGGSLQAFAGLAAGESQTRKLAGLSCFGSYVAIADDIGQVDESNEGNNTRNSGAVIC